MPEHKQGDSAGLYPFPLTITPDKLEELRSALAEMQVERAVEQAFECPDCGEGAFTTHYVLDVFKAVIISLHECDGCSRTFRNIAKFSARRSG